MSELASSKETKIAVGELKAMEEEIATLSNRIKALEAESAKKDGVVTALLMKLTEFCKLLMDWVVFTGVDDPRAADLIARTKKALLEP